MLNQIKYFHAIVRNHSFTKAAEECHISQSAISQQMKLLEQELNVQLLIRKNRSFSLTAAGTFFYEKSLSLVNEYDRLVQDTIRIARKDFVQLRIGFLKSYSGQAMQSAIANFSEQYPDVNIQIVRGNHEDLYEMLMKGQVDLVMSDQRRAFSDEYVNYSLIHQNCYIEIATRNPISRSKYVTPNDLKHTTCILIASKKQQKIEQEYYRNVFGFQSDFVIAEHIDEARLMVVQNNGFMLVDEGVEPVGNTTVRLPLMRRGRPMSQHYCVFWKQENTNHYMETFAELLKAEF